MAKFLHARQNKEIGQKGEGKIGGEGEGEEGLSIYFIDSFEKTLKSKWYYKIRTHTLGMHAVKSSYT